MATRLRGTTGDAAALLSLLAVAARPLTRAEVSAIRDWSPQQADHATDELVTRGLVVDPSGSIALAHDLVGAAVLQDMPADTRRDLHRAWADFLATHGGDDVGPLLMAIEHRRAAGDPALDPATRLVGSPGRTLLDREALALLGAIADEADAGSPQATQLAQDVASLAAEIGEQRIAQEPRFRHAHIDATRVEYEAALQDDDQEGMLRGAEECARAAEGFDERTYRVALAASAGGLRRVARAREPVRIELIDEAERRLRTAWTAARRRVLPDLLLESGYWLAHLLIEQGKLTDAQPVVAEICDLAARVGDMPRGRHHVEHMASELRLLRDWPAALEHADLRLAAEPSAHHRIPFHQLLAVWTARVEGEAGAGRVAEHIARGRADADSAGCPRCLAELVLRSAEALALVGDVRAAEAAIVQFQRARPSPPLTEWLLQARAEALVDRSLAPLVDLERRFADAALTVEAAWTRCATGIVLAPSDREAAVGTLRRAAELADRLEAWTLKQVAQRWLRTLGVRTWRRGPVVAGAGPLAGLTERERTVARLVAAGSSNPEIAHALFVSRKTVERQVSTILAKLQLRNRSELAVRASQADVAGDRNSGVGPRP